MSKQPSEKSLDSPITMTLRDYNELQRMATALTTYASDFRRLSALISWNDSALCSQYYEGLKEDVKDLFARFDRPESLPELIDLSIKIDNRLFERTLEKSIRPRQYFNNTPFVSPVTKPDRETPSQYQPMEIEGTTTRRTTLTPQERQRRRENNLCLYCGNPGHIIATCPLRSQSRTINSLSASSIDTQAVINQNQENSSTQF
ncbi:Retrotransposon-derived protein PEG10 [Smittium culicis]|uniref:Retrotransposon-derived protein PEG10 n=1 Tax=Smittium culicis TaxID=133412 RepID=A0A1R1XST5_9FUNG|nr:Retrotransposon-derived protein PEG10 [Smittium culicis]